MKLRDANLYNQTHINNYLSRTGILVDIQNIGKNTECLAVREKNSFEEVRSGVWLKKEALNLPSGSFTNVYDLFWDPKKTDIAPFIDTTNNPYSLASHMEKNANIVAVMNGSFFFLTDIADRKPIDLTYGLCIRDGKVLSLPARNRPIAYVKDGKLKTRPTKARGTLKIGKNEIKWIGARSNLKAKDSTVAILYNSKCSDVVRIRHVKSNIQIGVLDSINIYTPKDKKVTDIVIGKDKKNNLVVTKINPGGGTHFFDGSIILQIKKGVNKLRVGDAVTSIFLDGLNLSPIASGMSIGRSVHSHDFDKKSYIVTRDARSVLSKDREGNIHFVVFDGSKYIPGFEGVSTKECADYLSESKHEWAYFLDGGGSSRIVVRKESELEFLANEFAFKKYKSGAVVWDFQGARKLASSISIRLK